MWFRARDRTDHQHQSKKGHPTTQRSDNHATWSLKGITGAPGHCYRFVKFSLIRWSEPPPIGGNARSEGICIPQRDPSEAEYRPSESFLCRQPVRTPETTSRHHVV